jgi:hypothetical protein
MQWREPCLGKSVAFNPHKYAPLLDSTNVLFLGTSPCTLNLFFGVQIQVLQVLLVLRTTRMLSRVRDNVSASCIRV